VLEDYVLVVDANFLSGARVILPKIRAVSSKSNRKSEVEAERMHLARHHDLGRESGPRHAH
jgi:hypothetical protein